MPCLAFRMNNRIAFLVESAGVPIRQKEVATCGLQPASSTIIIPKEIFFIIYFAYKRWMFSTVGAIVNASPCSGRIVTLSIMSPFV